MGDKTIDKDITLNGDAENIPEVSETVTRQLITHESIKVPTKFIIDKIINKYKGSSFLRGMDMESIKGKLARTLPKHVTSHEEFDEHIHKVCKEFKIRSIFSGRIKEYLRPLVKRYVEMYKNHRYRYLISSQST